MFDRGSVAPCRTDLVLREGYWTVGMPKKIIPGAKRGKKFEVEKPWEHELFLRLGLFMLNPRSSYLGT